MVVDEWSGAWIFEPVAVTRSEVNLKEKRHRDEDQREGTSSPPNAMPVSIVFRPPEQPVQYVQPSAASFGLRSRTLAHTSGCCPTSGRADLEAVRVAGHSVGRSEQFP